jgi:glycosyltransferase involved in cell wall biosynthesis
MQNTDMLKDFFRQPNFARKCRLIPRGVDTEKFSCRLVTDNQVRKNLGITPQETVISCVAQLLPVKGQNILIEAAAQLKGPRLLLAGGKGDRDYFTRLKNITAECGVENRVHFLGNVDDIPGLLAATDIFVLPTIGSGRMEGCPVALLEAMSCGKACIATNIPGSRDLIVHYESGILVPPSDPKALGQALRLLVDNADLRAKLGAAARKRVEEKFTIEREVSAHEALYSELVKFHD